MQLVDIEETWDETGRSGQAVLKRYPLPEAEGAPPEAAGPTQEYETDGSDESGGVDDLEEFDALLEEMEALEWDESAAAASGSGHSSQGHQGGVAEAHANSRRRKDGTQRKDNGLRRGFLLPRPRVPLKPALKTESTVGQDTDRAVQETATVSRSRPSSSLPNPAFSGTVRERSAAPPEECESHVAASASRQIVDTPAPGAPPSSESQPPSRVSRFKQARSLY